MPLVKCPKCGEEYELMHFTHICKKDKTLRWEQASATKRIFTKRIFMCHPDAPRIVRYLVFLWLLFAVSPWIFLVMSYFFLGEVLIEGILYISTALWSVFYLLLAYGFSNLKRWSLYLLGVLSIVGLFVIEDIERFYSLIGLIIVLYFYKKFRY